MIVTELIDTLAIQGIQLRVQDDELLYAPKALVTPDMAKELRAHKAELMAMLRRDDSVTDIEFVVTTVHPSEIGADGWQVGTIPWPSPQPPEGRTWRQMTHRPSRTTPGACDKCSSTEWRDTSIHDGQSTRRECSKCGRFISFTRWYGNNHTEPTNEGG